MRVNEFLRRVVETTRRQLPTAHRSFHIRSRFTLVQLYYSKRTIHYEVWIRGKDRFIEIGLHFESDRETNSALLAYFREASQTFELKDTLGDQMEIEQWTASWARVHQLLPYVKLDEVTAVEVGSRLAKMIATLQPMLEYASRKSNTMWSG